MGREMCCSYWAICKGVYAEAILTVFPLMKMLERKDVGSESESRNDL